MIPVRHLSQVEDLKISKENGWSRSFPTHCCDDGQQTSTLHLPRFHWNWHRFLTGYPSFLDGGGSDLTSECGHVDVWTWGGGDDASHRVTAGGSTSQSCCQNISTMGFRSRTVAFLRGCAERVQGISAFQLLPGC